MAVTITRSADDTPLQPEQIECVRNAIESAYEVLVRLADAAIIDFAYVADLTDALIIVRSWTGEWAT